MKKIFLLFTFILYSITLAQTSIPVTFKVKMNIQKEEGNFNPSTDAVYVRGNFQKAVGDTTDWGGTTFTTSDPDGDMIYEIVINFPESTSGSSYQYKFVINDGGWEPFEPPRAITVTPPSMVLPVAYWNNDSVVTKYVYNTLNFTADLSEIYGTGEGFFDPEQDSVIIQGLTWNSTVSLVEGQRKMVEDPFSPAIFTTTLKIRAVEGDSTDWKAKAFPDGRFFNWGWEVQNSRRYHIIQDGAEANVPVFKVDIYPMKPALTQDVTALFQVDINGAVNRYNDKPIDLSKILFVGVKGQNSVLGSWGGGWVPDDTLESNRTLWPLNDSGKNGDKVAGDNIWSRQIVFPAGNTGGPSLFKYGIYYTGVEGDAPAGNSPMDNEFDSGDHSINIKDLPNIEILNKFGTYSPITSVRRVDNELPANYTLEQNYPNPFNPSTAIRYSVPTNGMVEIAIFNILGEKVASLINEEQTAGSYEIKFNAASMASGIYFYKLTSGSFSVTKKMMLVK